MGFFSDLLEDRDKMLKKAFGEKGGKMVSTIISPGYETYKSQKQAMEDKNYYGILHNLAASPTPAGQGVDLALANYGGYANKKTDGGLMKVHQVIKPIVWYINPVAGQVAGLAMNRADMQYMKEKYNMTDRQATEWMQKQNLKESVMGWGSYGIGNAIKAYQAIPGATGSYAGGSQTPGTLVSPGVKWADVAKGVGTGLAKTALVEGAKYGINRIAEHYKGVMQPNPTLQASPTIRTDYRGVPLSEQTQQAPLAASSMDASNLNWNSAQRNASGGRVDVTIPRSVDLVLTPQEEEKLRKKQEKIDESAILKDTPTQQYFGYRNLA